MWHYSWFKAKEFLERFNNFNITGAEKLIKNRLIVKSIDAIGDLLSSQTSRP